MARDCEKLVKGKVMDGIRFFVNSAGRIVSVQGGHAVHAVLVQRMILPEARVYAEAGRNRHRTTVYRHRKLRVPMHRHRVGRGKLRGRVGNPDYSKREQCQYRKIPPTMTLED